MDCQTETYSEVEELKDKKRPGCAYCDEILQSQAGKKRIEESFGAASVKNSEIFPDASGGSFYGSVIPSAEDVLEIPGPPYVVDNPEHLQIEDVFLLPEYEPETHPLEDEAARVNGFDDAQQRAATPEPETVPHLSNHSGSNLKSTAHEAVLLNEAPCFDESDSNEAGQLNKVRRIASSALGLRLIAAAFVLLIVMGGVLVTLSGGLGAKTEEPAKTVYPAGPETMQDGVPTAPPAHSTGEPVLQPTPAVVDNRPAPATSSTNQAVGQDEPALFTVQIGAHKEMGEAGEQAARVRVAGFEPRVVSVEIPKRGTWYRVQVGDFSNREEASRFGTRLRAEGVAESFIIASL
jgi:cell division septation protein DedD